MLVTEKVITETRIKCMYTFTFGRLRFWAKPLCKKILPFGLLTKSADPEQDIRENIWWTRVKRAVRRGWCWNWEMLLRSNNTASWANRRARGTGLGQLGTELKGSKPRARVWLPAAAQMKPHSMQGKWKQSLCHLHLCCLLYSSPNVWGFPAVLNFILKISIDRRGQKPTTLNLDMKY